METSDYKELFHYENGVLLWKKCRSDFVGRPAGAQHGGSRTEPGYLTVKVDGRWVKVHRIIYEMHHGPIPEGMQIDHISGDILDNRIENLRGVTKSDNMKNCKRYPNKTGLPGIGTYTLASGEVRYRAGIRNPQTSKAFKTLEEAVEFLEKLYEKHGYHPNHGRER